VVVDVLFISEMIGGKRKLVNNVTTRHFVFGLKRNITYRALACAGRALAGRAAAAGVIGT